MNSRRRNQLAAFLESLGLDPGAIDVSLEPVEEALSHSSAALERDHERLEFLGDAVLRLAAVEFLQRHHPALGVGRASALRAQLVSDRWLSGLAERCGLEKMLHLGSTALGDRAGRATFLAETCEALVGGVYEAWGGGSDGLAAVHTWLTPHWRAASEELLADPHRHNWKSALQEWSQGEGLGLPAYDCRERSRSHGDPRRFHCRVSVSGGHADGEGWGGSRREAEQQAARRALAAVEAASKCPGTDA